MKNIIHSVAALLLLSSSVFAGDLVNVSGASKVAVSGFDPVAFFSAEHQGATYFFTSEEHKKLFAADPAKYAPQFGGFCAFGVALDKLFPVDISTWQVRDGKLYLNLNPDILTKFNADFAGNLAKANGNWPGLVKANAP